MRYCPDCHAYVDEDHTHVLETRALALSNTVDRSPVQLHLQRLPTFGECVGTAVGIAVGAAILGLVFGSKR
jgi:hypothetical protein